MKTVFLYPGLNGLIKSEDRNRYLHLESVQKRLKTVQNIFLENYGESFDFEEYFKKPLEEIYSVDNIGRAATAICAIQVGITDHLKKQNIHADWMLGCSLGDLARSVSAGMCSFEECIDGYIKFAKELKGIEKIGANIGVSKGKGQSFSKDEIQEMNDMGLDVSVMTPLFLNIGGRYSDLESFRSLTTDRRWRVVKILDYPAHSRYISSFVENAMVQIQNAQVKEPEIKLFSSISCKEMTCPKELKAELILNMTKPLRWGEALVSLEKQEGPLQFINIGPCQSISKMIKDLPLKSELRESFA